MVGLVFTDLGADAMRELAGRCHGAGFARPGSVAPYRVHLAEGPLHTLDAEAAPVSHTQEAQLRGLGLPTQLRGGVVELARPHTVCERGDALDAGQCGILRALRLPVSDLGVRLAGWFDGEAEGYCPLDVGE